MPVRLHHERIVHSEAAPTRWLLLTHGIYGAGSNWRGIARKITDQRRDWGVVLVDLRHHGRSPGGPDPSIAACAEDIALLADEVGDVHALAGHSFGGKVMLAARAEVAVAQTWLLDSSPRAHAEDLTAPGNSVIAVLDLLDRLPKTWAQRDDFVAAVVAEGQDLALAQWLAMNVVPGDDGVLTLRLDLGALRALLADYYAQDLWPALLDPARGAVELVIADRSDTVSAEDRARLAEAPAHVHVHHIDAGHWLHIAAPAAVVALFVEQLPS